MMEVYTKFLLLLIFVSSTAVSALTQTEAHLSLFKKDVQCKWRKELMHYKAIVDSCITKEQQYYTTHYVFYHGQPGDLRIIYDFLTELYILMHGLSTVPANFLFLRSWNNAALDIPLDSFIDQAYRSFSYPTKQVMWANLSLFGNTTTGICSSFYYFMNNHAHQPLHIRSILTELFKSLGLPQKYIAQLVKLYSKIRCKEGSLIQIFIPREQVDACVYLVWDRVTPVDQVIVPAYYSHTKRRHTAISPILEKYCTNPGDIAYIDDLQAAITISKKYMLNPTSGIKQFIYTTIPDQKLADYNKELKNITKSLFKEWATHQQVAGALSN